MRQPDWTILPKTGATEASPIQRLDEAARKAEHAQSLRVSAVIDALLSGYPIREVAHVGRLAPNTVIKIKKDAGLVYRSGTYAEGGDQT